MPDPGCQKHGTYEQGRLDAAKEIQTEIDRRIAIVSESIASGRHQTSHSIALQVARRMLQVLANDLDKFDKA